MADRFVDSRKGCSCRNTNVNNRRSKYAFFSAKVSGKFHSRSHPNACPLNASNAGKRKSIAMLGKGQQELGHIFGRRSVYVS